MVMDYIQIRDGKAAEIIPAIDQMFPGVPITDRYAPWFLDICVTAPQGTVQPGDTYDPATRMFTHTEDAPAEQQ